MMLQSFNKLVSLSSVAVLICFTVGCTTANKSKKNANWQNMQPSFMPGVAKSPEPKKGWLKNSISNIANTLTPKVKTAQKRDATHVDVMPIGGVDANVYTFAGQISAGKQEWNDAKRHFEKALSIDSENIGALKGFGAVLIEQEQYEEAIDYFRKGIAFAEEPQALELASEISFCYLQLQQDEKAISILQSLVNKAPENTMFRHQLAYALTKNGRADSALEHLSVLMDSADALNRLAGIQNELGMVEQAKISAERAQSVVPEVANVVQKTAQQVNSSIDAQIAQLNSQRQQAARIQSQPLKQVQAIAERTPQQEVNRQATFVSADLQPIQVTKFDDADRQAAESRIKEKIALIETKMKAENQKKKPLAKFRPLTEKLRPITRFSADAPAEKTSSKNLPSNIETLLR